MEPLAVEAALTFSAPEAPLELLPAGWAGKGARPLEIDVGCHKGRFLMALAQSFPSSNFLGVERRPARVEKARKRLAWLGLANAEVVHGDALEIIGRLPDSCVDCVHVLFPDPWPKRRHTSRRLVGPEFMVQASRILKARGILRLMTDDYTYARAMETAASRSRAFDPAGAPALAYPATEFQSKFLANSRPVHELLFRRVN